MRSGSGGTVTDGSDGPVLPGSSNLRGSDTFSRRWPDGGAGCRRTVLGGIGCPDCGSRRRCAAVFTGLFVASVPALVMPVCRKPSTSGHHASMVAERRLSSGRPEVAHQLLKRCSRCATSCRWPPVRAVASRARVLRRCRTELNSTAPRTQQHPARRARRRALVVGHHVHHPRAVLNALDLAHANSTQPDAGSYRLASLMAPQLSARIHRQHRGATGLSAQGRATHKIVSFPLQFK